MRVEYLQALVLAVPMLVFTIWVGRTVWKGGYRRAVIRVCIAAAVLAVALMLPALVSTHLGALLLAGTGGLLVAPVALGLLIVIASGRS